jgi:hypothetical protein
VKSLLELLFWLPWLVGRGGIVRRILSFDKTRSGLNGTRPALAKLFTIVSDLNASFLAA